MKERAPRIKVLVQAQMRADGPSVSVCIRDVGPRGMLLQAEQPPVRGTYVEISGPGLSVVGQVVWAKNRRFGIMTRERLNPQAFVRNMSAPKAADPATAIAAQRGGVAAAPRMRTADQSRNHASLIQFALAIAFFVAVAGLLADSLYARLTATFGSVSTHMNTSATP